MNAIIATLLLHGMVSETGALGVVNSKQSKFEERSVCVFSRIIQPELPYVHSWIKHHESLGVQTFYLLTNRPKERDTISAFLGGASCTSEPVHSGSWFIPSCQAVGSNATIKLYTTDGEANDWENAVMTQWMLAQIKEEFVVGIDIDEYWVMPKGVSTFSGLIAADHGEADVHYASWQMVLNDDFDVKVPPYQVWQGREAKWMAKASKIEVFYSHSVKTWNHANGGVRYDQGELLHFWGRSFQDQLLKGITQRDPYKGGEGPAKTFQLLDNGLLPQRLKLLAFLTIHPGEKHMPFRRPLLTREGNLEMQYLSVAFNTTLEQTQQILNKARETYLAFKACLTRQTHLPVYPGDSLVSIAKDLDKLCMVDERSHAQRNAPDVDFNRTLASIDDL